MKKDYKKPWEVYKNSNKDSVDLNFQDATYHLKNIIECQKRIKDLEEQRFNSQLFIQNILKESEFGEHNDFKVTWGSIFYKPVPEKVIPAKEGRVIRRKSITIRKI